MEKSKNTTLADASMEVGLSQGRISQLIHGYTHKGRGEHYLPLLEEELHWVHEMRGRRIYTVITPEGMELLRKVKNRDIRQKKEHPEK